MYYAEEEIFKTKIIYMQEMYILDGYNILRKQGLKVGALRIKEDIPSLLEFLSRYKPQGRNKVIIVFDGYGDNVRKYDNISVVFSHASSADDYIVKFLESREKNCFLKVVTDDRDLGLKCRNLGAKLLKVDEFISPIVKKMDNKKQKMFHEKINLFSKEAQDIRKELEKIWLKK